MDSINSKQEHRRKVAKPLLWIGMVSIIMMFAGLTSGYIVRRAEGNWIVFEMPRIFYVSTILLALSSVALVVARRAVKRSQYKSVKTGVAIAFLMGVGFLFSQVEGWRQLVDIGVYFTGPGSNAAGSFFYVITLAHVLHVVAGLIVLAVVFRKTILQRYTADDHLGLDLGMMFWHFLGVLWLYLFLFLAIIR